jgi:hypothetical protein
MPLAPPVMMATLPEISMSNPVVLGVGISGR